MTSEQFTHCYPEGNEINPMVKLLIGGVGISCFTVLGTIGNVISITILMQPSMRTSSTNNILLGLSCYDTFYVGLIFLSYSISGIVDYFCVWPTYYDIIYSRFFPYIFPMLSTAQTGSIYLTITVTIERFIVVYKPLYAKSICTTTNARRAICIITLFSVLYNLPVWFMYSSIAHVNPRSNLTMYYEVLQSDLAKSEYFQLYYMIWCDNIFGCFIPMILLTILNFAIFNKIRQSRRLRAELTKTETEHQEVRVGIMLMVLVSIFLICYTIPLISRIQRMIGPSLSYSTYTMRTMGDFAVTINSSVNFIIYCLCGKEFRKVLISLCGCKCK